MPNIISDQDKQDFEKELKKQINYYTNILNLNEYRITVKQVNCEYLNISTNLPYYDVIIGYSDSIVQDFLDKKDISFYILHEVCHLITEDLYHRAFDRFTSESRLDYSRERTTDRIAGVINNLLKNIPF
jgi:predicted metal-dependent hydrolase